MEDYTLAIEWSDYVIHALMVISVVLFALSTSKLIKNTTGLKESKIRYGFVN